MTLKSGLGVETRYVCWGAGIADLDNDGLPDLFIAAGQVYPELEKQAPLFPYKNPRIVFRNLGGGRFEELFDEAGPAIASAHSSRGCAFGDFDNDGDIDIVIMNMNEPPSLLRNDNAGQNRWLKVQLEATTSNRSAIGARVTARYGKRLQVQEVMSQSSFLSVNDKRLHFGLGPETSASLEIRWPNGVKQTFSGVPANNLVVIREGVGIVATRKTSIYAMRRRSFLRGGLALPFLRRLKGQETPLVDAGFHLHPHYRAQTALDATLLKTKAGLDDFITEKYQDQIAVILAQWRVNLVASMEKVLAPGFLGASPQPVTSRIVRPGPALEVRRVTFSEQPTLGRDAFLQQLRASLRDFSTILTAEFQVTQIDVQPDGGLRTRVRYELVGAGHGFHREQRIGWWNLDWEPAPYQGGHRLRSWRATEDTRSRSAKPWYEDIASEAFAGASSYSDQMLRGVDYWRTVLDGASGIDIYGHNGVSVGDIDGDGFDDLYVCQPAGLPNRLYRNRGDGTFEDISEASAVGLLENTACAIFADFDNDGRQDLIIVRANGPLLFLNQGGGKFRLKPNAFQFANPPQGTFTGAAAADYDRDGWLDIYFCLYVYYQGADQYRYPAPYYAAENGPPNFMLRNNRDGTFRDVTAQSGLNRNNTRYSFCCGWGDYNRDGWPDLYVVNDFGRKNLYRNNGDGTFTDVAPQAGVGRCRRRNERVLVRLRQRWRRGPVRRGYVDRRRRARLHAGDLPTRRAARGPRAISQTRDG